MMKGLEDVLGIELPKGEALATEEARLLFEKIAKEKGVDCANPRTTSRQFCNIPWSESAGSMACLTW